MNSAAKATLWASALLLAFALVPADAVAAGFEVPENTTRAVSRGGTGVASKNDPSAIYFNPALLTDVAGFQFLTNVNVVALSLDFQRDDLVYEQGDEQETQSFSPISNQSGPFPAPFVAASYDFGVDNLGVAIGAFGPSAYGSRCYTQFDDDGECAPSDTNAARLMLVSSDIIEIYFSAAAAYAFELGPGEMSVGLTGIAAYQEANFRLVIDEIFPVAQPWNEDPNNQAFFEATELSGWRPTGIIGLGYRLGGLTFGASYRPPIHWETEGVAEIDFPDALDSLAAPKLTDDALVFRTWQAGSLRLGAAWEDGVQPGRDDNPLYSAEFNVVWEDWSRVQDFEIEPQGDVSLFADEENEGEVQELRTISQHKGYQDAFSFRLGGTFAPMELLSFHLGGYYETAAQPKRFTNLDFVSWNRIAGGLGTTVHIADYADVELGYQYVFQPDRDVEDGGVFQQIPLSSCTGPDYDADTCETPGTPPGSPQNEGQWSSNFQIFSVGVTARVP